MRAGSYRADVDGLRAVAISSVVLFHASRNPIVPGGFTGVDVFFVISGYLITSIIAREMSEGSFSLLRFYERRIKRIVPALVVVLLACLGAGWFVLQPGDYAAMAQSAIYATLSFSNVFFLNHTGYFDAAAHTMPLLHTWSLGVEEQFYIVWPAFLGIAFWVSRAFQRCLLAAGAERTLFARAQLFARPALWVRRAARSAWQTSFAQRTVLWLVLPVAVLGLLYSAWLTGADSKAAFYLSSSRAYELLIGALVALGVVPRALSRQPLVAHAASLAGAGLIVCGFLLLDAGQPFPGLKALLPTLGAALIIASGSESRGIVNRVLSLPPFVYLGKISYSLYLWHWPVLVLYAHYASRPATPYEAAVLIGVALALSTLSYRLVEQPARASKRSLSFYYGAFAGSTAAVALPALAVILTSGALARVPPDGRGMASPEAMWHWDCPAESAVAGLSITPARKLCIFGASAETAKQHALLWGDSHAEHYAPLLDIVGRETGTSFVLYTGCDFMADEKAIFDDRGHGEAGCRDRALAWLSERPGTLVLLASVWSGVPSILNDGGKTKKSPENGLRLMTMGIENTIRNIDPARHPILLLGQFPQVLGVDVLCAQRMLSTLLMPECHTGTALNAGAERNYHRASSAALKAIAQKYAVGLVEPVNHLCTGESCPTFINGEFIYRDYTHLRRNLREATKREIAARIKLADALRCSACDSRYASASQNRGPVPGTPAKLSKAE